MPGKARAFYPYREFAHAGKDPQAAQCVWLVLFIELTNDHPVKLIEECFRILLCLALDRNRHHACRRFGDRAPRALKADVLESIVLHLRINGKLIAAEWIRSFCVMAGSLNLMKVTRLLVMVKNNLLIEFAKFRHRLDVRA